MINSREWIRRYYHALRKTSHADSGESPAPLSPMSMMPGSSYDVNQDWSPGSLSSPMLPSVMPNKGSSKQLPVIPRKAASAGLGEAVSPSSGGSSGSEEEEDLPQAEQEEEDVQFASPPSSFRMAPLIRAETAPLQGYPDVRELDKDFEEQIQDIALISSFEELEGDPWMPAKLSSSAERVPGLPEGEDPGIGDEDSLLLGEEEEALCRPCFPCVDPSRGVTKTDAKRYLRTCKTRTPYYIPILSWFPKYDIKENLMADLLVGITIAAVVIPQGIAYSSLVYLPPVYGLYTAWMPMIMYFLLGSSRQLAIGPEGVISLLSGSALLVGASAASNEDALFEETIPRAALLAFMVGIFTLCLGLFRVGFLDNLISRPILHGFVSASAAIIFVGQLDKFLGFQVDEVEWEVLIGVVENLDETNWYSLGIGIGSLILIILYDFAKKNAHAEKILRYVPIQLIVVILTTFIVWVFSLDEKGVLILNTVQGGFPIPKVPQFWNFTMISDMLVEAVLISIVGFVESNAIAKAYSNKHGYDVSANRELVALGGSNVVSSFFGAYPAFGSLSRSKIADGSGSRTQLFGFFASCIVLVCMVFLMPLFTYLPKSAIAAIIMVASAKLIDFHLGFLVKLRAFLEIFLTFITFLATFFLGAELGIIIAIGISLFLVVKHTTLPNVAVLGQTSDGKWRDITVLKSYATVYPGVMVIRIDESLYFGNVEQLTRMVKRLVAMGKADLHPTESSVNIEAIKYLIIDTRNIHSIDPNAAECLREMTEEFVNRGVDLGFVHVREEHQDLFSRAGITAIIGWDHLFPNISSAVSFMTSRKQIGRAHV